MLRHIGLGGVPSGLRMNKRVGRTQSRLPDGAFESAPGSQNDEGDVQSHDNSAGYPNNGRNPANANERPAAPACDKTEENGLEYCSSRLF